MTNANGQVVTTSYDALCRFERSDGPLGMFAETSYVNLGNPTQQHVELEIPSPEGVGVAWARSYFDGLGHEYRVERSGANGQVIVVDELSFNARGKVRTTTRPRFATESPYVTTLDYDARDRLVRATLPDAATSTATYGLRAVTETNAEGHSTTRRVSPNSLTRYLDEHVGAATYTTTTSLDRVNRTETVTDAVGNTRIEQSDSLGRVVGVWDPDLGMESREYNDSNELAAVTNALAERTELSYDLLGRPTSRRTRVGMPGEETTTFGYDEPRTGYFNVGFATSMFDSSGAFQEDFDALGRLARRRRTLDGVTYTKTFNYNAAGVLTSAQYPDGQSISWSYDAAGNVRSETGTLGTASYDASGQPTEQNFSNGVVRHEELLAEPGMASEHPDGESGKCLSGSELWVLSGRDGRLDHQRSSDGGLAVSVRRVEPADPGDEHGYPEPVTELPVQRHRERHLQLADWGLQLSGAGSGASARGSECREPELRVQWAGADDQPERYDTAVERSGTTFIERKHCFLL